MSACRAPLDLATLAAYWLGELAAADEARVEEHYLGCAECSARLEELAALARGVRAAFVRGHFASFLTPAFVARLEAEGLRVREYRVPANGSVNCTVRPEDDVLLGRLQAPLAGVSRLDAVMVEDGERLEDVPFDPASGEVVMSPGIAHVRTLPAHRQCVRLIAVEAGGERVVGEYTFNHQP